MSDEPPGDDALADLARQIDQLQQAGARVVLSPEAMAADVLGTLSQQLPNGPLIVDVDATKPLAQQASMLVTAFEFLFDEPPSAPWVYRSATTREGHVLHFRRLTVRRGR